VTGAAVDGRGVCAVVAAGPGIGAAVARRFAREGFAVALLARRRDELDRQAAGIAAAGGTARGFAADAADEASLRAALAAVADELGPPDVLAYNAGRWAESPAMALDPAAFRAELELDAVGALVAAQAVFPAMRDRGAGTMLFTGGGLALRPEYGGAVPALTAGKSALRGLVLAMAPELAAAGVHAATVTVAGMVAPGGPFDPDRVAEAFWEVHAEPRGAWSAERVFSGA
jgi:NAD(P)-dependent dehydrogenase (short-subunit alcohol dehydrogenase family)